jgi:hypothetical protein
LSKKHEKNTRLAEALPDFGLDNLFNEGIRALLGEYAFVVSKSRFLMGNIITDVSGNDLENYED